MIVTLIVILYLGYQTYKGYQLGFAQRVINMIFGAIVFAAAILGQNSLGNWFYQQFSMCQAFQNPWFIQQTVDSPILRVIIYNTPGLSNGVFKTIFGISRTVG